LPEVCGDAAEYVDIDDTPGLAEALKRVLTSSQRAEELRQLGYENIKRFDWSKSAKTMIDILDSVLS
ncbi:MAG: glycosyltransferase family 1 protein, partial [Planctomycetota bacterium]|nr:glycosyltransferase family 1 protein [Planctomycetota bacterium]